MCLELKANRAWILKELCSTDLLGPIPKKILKTLKSCTNHTFQITILNLPSQRTLIYLELERTLRVLEKPILQESKVKLESHLTDQSQPFHLTKTTWAV